MYTFMQHLLGDHFYHIKPYLPRFKPQGLISFMVHNHPGSNQDYKSIESIKLDG